MVLGVVIPTKAIFTPWTFCIEYASSTVSPFLSMKFALT